MVGVGTRTKRPHLLDRRDERVDLHGAAPLQVLQHGSAVRTNCSGATDALLDVHREAHPPASRADGLCLGHHGPGHCTGPRLAGDHVQGLAGEGADRVEAKVSPELHPDLVANAADRGPETAGDQRVGERLNPFGLLVGGLSERESIAADVPVLPQSSKYNTLWPGLWQTVVFAVTPESSSRCTERRSGRCREKGGRRSPRRLWSCHLV